MDLERDLIRGVDANVQLSALLNTAFAVQPGRQFLDDFPIWNEQLVPTNDRLVRVGIFEGDSVAPNRRLLASAAVRLADVLAPGGPLPVALIGAVATDPSWRGRGLASRAVSLAVVWARERGASIVALWGSEAAFYSRFDFALCGRQARLPLGNSSLSLIDDPRVKRGWDPCIFPRLQARKRGLVLRESDLAWISAHRNVDWFWIEGDVTSAYAAVGRGIDLSNLVHEWGGDPVQLRGLLAEVQRAHPAAEILGSPADFAALGLPIDRANEEYLCLAQVVNPARIISAFLPGAARSATGTGDRWDIIVGESEYRGVTTQQLGPLLFGLPGADQGLLLPLWFWGLDGV